jgi:hypothetical protein
MRYQERVPGNARDAEEMCIASLAWFNRTNVGRQEQFKRISNLIDCGFLGADAVQTRLSH